MKFVKPVIIWLVGSDSALTSFARTVILLFTFDSQWNPSQSLNYVHLYYLGRGVVNFHANHHYSSIPALNAVIQKEYSYYQREARSSSSCSEPMLSPASPSSPQDHSPQDLWKIPRNHQHRPDRPEHSDHHMYHHTREQHSTRESTPRDTCDETWELREIIPLNRNSKEIQSLRDSIEQEDAVFIHERESSISSTYSHSSQRSSNTLPHQKKSSSSSDSRYSVQDSSSYLDFKVDFFLRSTFLDS